MEYPTTLLVNPLTLEPSTDKNTTSGSIYSESDNSYVGAAEVAAFPKPPPPPNLQFGDGTRKNGRRFKWTMNSESPNLKVEQRRSILKAKSCRGQREKEKWKYLQLQEIIKQKDDMINHLLRRITGLEELNEKIYSDNTMLLENEEVGNDNDLDRDNGLITADVEFDMESFY